MNFKIAIAIVLFSLAQLSFGQADNDSIVYVIKGEYIEKYPNRITGKLFYTNTFNSYVFSDRNSGIRVEAEPNKQNRIGASVSYSFITGSYSIAPNFLAENKDNEDSRLFNLNLRIFPGKWMQTIDIYSEKGFYLKNQRSAYFPDIKSLKIGGSTSYILNDNFSYRAVSNQDEKQIQSAGSFIPGITYYYSKFNIVADDSNGNRIDEDLHSYDIALTPSYHYNFVPFDNFMLSLGANAGIGLNHSKSDDESLTSLLTEWSVSATTTYSVEKFYLGAHFRYLELNHNTDRTTVTEDNIPFFQIFVGYRFKAPKKWVKTTNELMEKLKEKVEKKEKKRGAKKNGQ